jgi:hypothetical protein
MRGCRERARCGVAGAARGAVYGYGCGERRGAVGRTSSRARGREPRDGAVWRLAVPGCVGG